MPFTCNLPLLLLLSSLFLSLSRSCLALHEDRQVYIVYMGALPNPQKLDYSPRSHHLSILENVLQGRSAEDTLIYSYKRSLNGFAAALSDAEQSTLANMEGVVSVFPSRTHQIHTTRSWDFIGFPATVKRVTVGESNVIVGVLDSGAWPESESFSDEGFGPPPKKWKGTCQTDGNFTCNNKLIGAQYYKDPSFNGMAKYGARDAVGHGTHTASIAAGREVKGVSLFGLAQGDARDAVPSARIAVYKVCLENGCPDEYILAGFDDAIADGVDIISVSIGPVSGSSNYSNDSLAIGSFHAMMKGILISQSVGNDGPTYGTIRSLAPWILTVAASSIGRKIISKVVTRNGSTLLGHAINTYNSTKIVPLILGTNASSLCTDQEARLCSADCLDEQLVKGKIVFCESLNLGYGPLRAGAIGQMLKNGEANDYSFVYPFPSTSLHITEGYEIKKYIESTREPQAKILKSEATPDLEAPKVPSFSSRGPNSISPDILKPDIAAPGVEIIAAFSPIAPLTNFGEDKRSVKYNILSGTSMACPHVSGAAAYVKAFHPEWSSAAIKSALMTTASPMNAGKNTEAEFAYGAGQVNPVKAVDPGLVYDTQKDEYIQFLCNEGYSSRELRLISGENVICRDSNRTTARDLNYPSMQLLVMANKSFSSNFLRSVTNVGSPASTYKAMVNPHPQLQVTVSPSVLSFKSLNEERPFVVTVAGSPLQPYSIISTWLEWSDDVHNVRSPIVAYTRIHP